ncbi:MAG: hypothetical protein WBJ13_04250, partial [Sedimentibacter sp.]
MSLCLSFSYRLAYPLLLGANIKWSIQKRYQQGRAHCPTAFFLGYEKDKNGNLIINEEQAITVRRIYN